MIKTTQEYKYVVTAAAEGEDGAEPGPRGLDGLVARGGLGLAAEAAQNDCLKLFNA